MDKASRSSPRLYQDLARKLLEDFSSGTYAPGDRLPTERELAQAYKVSRPTVREAMIALEVQGIVDVRVGSGAYLATLPGEGLGSAFAMSAFELTEARLLVEAETAALAAAQITDDEILRLEALVRQIAQENAQNEGAEDADREFHLTIARATRNAALLQMVETLWNLRSQSPESALLHAKARTANVKPVVDEHRAILDALRTRKPAAARKAMRAHLSAVMDSLLFATEERAIAEARQASQLQRIRYVAALD